MADEDHLPKSCYQADKLMIEHIAIYPKNLVTFNYLKAECNSQGRKE